MNKKNFKLEYDNYMKNIKPSTDLIQQTLKLAEEEQSRLQRSKEEKNRLGYYATLTLKDSLL